MTKNLFVKPQQKIAMPGMAVQLIRSPSDGPGAVQKFFEKGVSGEDAFVSKSAFPRLHRSLATEQHP